MAEAAYVDSNVLLRYFLGDDPNQLAAVQNWLVSNEEQVKAQVFVTPSTVSEVVFVARGATYRSPRSGLVALVDLVLNGPFEVVDRDVVSRANEFYREVHDDWDDCLLAAYALERGDGSLVSFDRGLDRIPGLTRIEPTAPAGDE